MYVLVWADRAGRHQQTQNAMQNKSNQINKKIKTPQKGAELYESLLLDAEPAANYGNWAYAAGAGADPRGRAFKTVTQGERYDAGAALAARWLPELRALPAGACFISFRCRRGSSCLLARARAQSSLPLSNSYCLTLSAHCTLQSPAPPAVGGGRRGIERLPAADDRPRRPDWARAEGVEE
jgi:hypothetical protein